MAAFRAAVEVGVDCIETDVHVTRDKFVVLSHVSKMSFVCLDCCMMRLVNRTPI